MSVRLRKMPGGFGSGMTSGGSGVRGSSARGRSRVTTARDRDSKIERKEVPSGRLDMPTKEQLQAAMADGYCWWCGRTESTKGVPFTSWGHHWSTKGHGFDLQEIRDILEVPKRGALCAPSHSAICRKRSREQFEKDPEAFRGRFKDAAKKPREYSKYGLKVQREKLMNAPQGYGSDEGRRKAIKIAQRVNRERNAWKHIPRPCAACGKLFDPGAPPFRLKGKTTRKTCSDACWNKLRTPAPKGAA